MSFHPAHEMHLAGVQDRRGRLTAGLLALAVHALLVPLLLFGLVNQVVTIPEKVTIADLLRSPVHARPDAPPAPHRPRMAPPEAAAPEIVIEARAPARPAPGPALATVPTSPVTMSSGGGSADGGAKTGAGGGGAGGGTGYDLSDYLRRVAFHIQSHLIVPTRLGQGFWRHETTGTVLVHLIFRPDGTVKLAEIARSSGVPAFDEAALAAVHRSDPLPPFPPDVPLDHINGVLPISLTLNVGAR